MGLFGKPKISEEVIAGQFVLHVCRGVEESWPKITDELRQLLHDDASVLDDQFAPFEFALAVIATQMQALSNLLPADQAGRLRSHIIRCLCSDELGTYPKEALDEYQAAWDRSLQVPEPPYFGIASVLFDKLGCSEALSIGRASFKSPITLMALGSTVVTFGGAFWKTAVSQYSIVS
jgi:hypothetical protein